MLSVDDVVLLDSLGHDLLALEQREAGMRIRTSKMEITYFCWKRVECSFRVRAELLAQAEEEREIERGGRTLYISVVVTR